MAELEPLFGAPLIETLQGIAARVRSGETRTDQFYRECPMCFNTGWASTYRTYNGTQYQGVIKCDSCERWKPKAE